MDKRSFNFLFAIVAASMVVLGTYKMAKKKGHILAAQTPTVSKNTK